jgi:N utilization substance protein B
MSKARHKARRLATQALYAWQMSGQDLTDIDEQIRLDHDMSKVDQEYFNELLHKVPSHLQELDNHITPLLDRDMDNVDPTERAILRLSTYEMAFRLDVPYRVVINEGVELAKTFGAEDGHKFVNSILDGVAKKLRTDEVKASGSRSHASKKASIKVSKKAPKKIPAKISTKTSSNKTPGNKKGASGK